MNLTLVYLLLLMHICLAAKTDENTPEESDKNTPKETDEKKPKTYRLQILHNNDLHSKFTEMDEYCAPCPQESVEKKECYGGFARIKKAADEARKKATDRNIPSIFLNAGDNFSGSPYYDKYKEKVVKDLIDRLGLDAMALGNHEFDNKMEGLVAFLKDVETPVVCANLDRTKEPKMNMDLPKLTPSKIIERKYNGEIIKIGVIGYITLDAKGRKTGELIFNEIVPAVRAEAQHLKEEKKVNFIIGLGHVGFDEDIKIAKEVKEINMIVSGDSHTLLYSPKNEPPSVEEVTAAYPEIVEVEKKDKEGKVKKVKVPVVQAYAYGKYLGVLEVEFDEDGHVLEAKGNTQLLDSNFEKDDDLENKITEWTDRILEEIKDFKDIIGHTRAFLKKPSYNEGKFESNFANFITDALVDHSVLLAQENKEETWTKTPISFFPGGGIRVDIANNRRDGALTVEDLMTIMPFQNEMYELTVRGSTIRKFLERSINLFKEDEFEFDGKHYIHFSGLRVKFDLTKPIDDRVVSVDVLCRECDIPEFLALKDDLDYGIITPITEANKFKEIQVKKESDENLIKAYHEKLLGFKDLDPIKAFLKRNKVIAPILDKRVTVSGFKLKKRISSVETKEESIRITVN